MVEIFAFGSEFTAINQAIEIMKGLRYKICLFGMPIENSELINCNNEVACKNMSIPGYALNKKIHRISYHFFREVVAS